MADRVIVRELINLIGVEVDSQAEATVSSFLEGIEGAVNRAGKFFFFLGELLEGITQGLDMTVGALFRLVTGVAQGADEMRLAAESAGVSARSFQELAYAASTVEVDAGAVRSVLLEVAKSARLVSQGNEQAKESFSRVGLSAYDAAGRLKDPDVLLGDIADKLAKMPAGSKRSAAAFDLLGNNGTKLLPVLSKGREGLAALAREGHELGVVLDDDVIRASDDYMSELGKLEAAVQVLRSALAGPFLKVLTQVAVRLTDIAKELRPIISSKAKAFVDGLNRALANSAKITQKLHDALILLAGLMLGRMLFALSTLTAAQVSWGLAALISGARAAAAGAMAAGAAVLPLLPWLALGAAIVLVGEEILSFFTGADGHLKRFIRFLDSVNPRDTPLLELFKSLGSLVFDITDPKKWTRLFSAIGANFEWLLNTLKAVAKWFGRVIGDTTISLPAAYRVDTRTGERIPLTQGIQPTRLRDLAPDQAMTQRMLQLSQQQAPMEALFGRGGSPTAAVQSVQSSQSGPTVFAPSFTLQQEVNAAPNQSAVEVGQSAARSGEDLFTQELERTYAVFGR